MESPSQPNTNFFNHLTEELIVMILDHIQEDPFATKSFSQVNKSFHSIESIHRTKLKPRRLEFLPTTLHRYPSISHLDFSLCPCVDDDALTSVSLAWSSCLKSINLSGSRLFTHVGLLNLVLNCSSNLVEIDLSNRTDLTDSAAKAIAEAVNLERLLLGRCKSITDMGIGCIAVKCSKLRCVGLRWCIRVTDFGVGLIAIKCKQIRSLDLSYLPITEKCLLHIFELKHLEDLVLEHCLGIDDEGLASLKASNKSMKMLNLSKCQNITHIGLTSLTNGAQNLEKLILSYSLPVTDDLGRCLQSFSRLQVVKLDGCVGTCSGLKAIGNSCASLRELSLSKCVAVTDECLSFLVQTHTSLDKVDITCCRKITHASIESITRSCSRLTSLRMESCSSVSREAFSFIGRCQFLEELDVTDTEIDDEGLESISTCTKLSILKMGICLNITDNGLKHIGSRCSQLKHLDLYRSSGITEVGVAAIALGCPSLEVINIAYNSNITDTSLASLSNCLKLRALEIRGCPHISSVGLSSIAVRCRNLEVLDIKKCYKINDTAMVQLAQYSQNLKQIKLSHCSITDIGLIALSNISCLQHISIFNLEGLTSNGLVAFLLACQSLTKMKLNTSFKSLLPKHMIEYMEARACVLIWKDKSFETFRFKNVFEMSNKGKRFRTSFGQVAPTLVGIDLQRYEATNPEDFPTSISMHAETLQRNEFIKDLTNSKVQVLVISKMGTKAQTPYDNSESSVLGTYQVAKWNGTKVSVKILDKESYSDLDIIDALKHELTLLERVRHPNVVQFVGAVTQNIPMMIVREVHAKGDLANYLQNKSRLSPSKALRFALDIARQVTTLPSNAVKIFVNASLKHFHDLILFS
ncbi:hypothetical protein RIF29_17214 [Crotalaria pallida]|uniref:Protein kinase domain-containing protein n=1 Tax=Crotalaria pallida TaxID=3830 RepID=A0AAN9IEB4_CROPI